jgi:copper chaperone NosL
MSRALVLLFLGFFVFACTSHDPEPIHIGHDTCDHCRMVISDPKFGGEIIYKTGKILKFDALTCMAAHQAENNEKIDKIYSHDFNQPGKFVDVSKAFFLQSSKIRGPMGVDIIGIGGEPNAQSLVKKLPGKLMKWEEALPILNAK